MPDEILTISFIENVKFSAKEMEMLYRGYASADMDDYFHIYFDNMRLYIHNNWNGDCLYIVYFLYKHGLFHISKIDINQKYIQVNNDYIVIIQSIINKYLLNGLNARD